MMIAKLLQVPKLPTQEKRALLWLSWRCVFAVEEGRRGEAGGAAKTHFTEENLLF